MAAKKVLVKQVRSGIGHPKNEKQTLVALGLGKIGRIREHTESPALSGMLATVKHLIEVRAK